MMWKSREGLVVAVDDRVSYGGFAARAQKLLPVTVGSTRMLATFAGCAAAVQVFLDAAHRVAVADTVEGRLHEVLRHVARELGDVQALGGLSLLATDGQRVWFGTHPGEVREVEAFEAIGTGGVEGALAALLHYRVDADAPAVEVLGVACASVAAFVPSVGRMHVGLVEVVAGTPTVALELAPDLNARRAQGADPRRFCGVVA